MFTLYKYELKKIFSQKYFLLVSLVMTLFLMAVGITPYFTGSIPSNQDAEVVSGRYIDDSLINEAKENNGKGVYSTIIDFMKQSVNSNQIDDYSSKDIYDERLQTIENDMKNSYLSEAEINYWHEKGKEIETPFVYYVDTGYAEVYDLISFLCMCVLMIVNVATSGIFAGEKASGTDQIILCTQNGRGKLFGAKLLACITVGILIPLVIFVIIVLVELSVFGFEGFNTPLQVHIPTCLYKVTIGESLLYCLARLIPAGIMWSCFTLFLSELTGKQQACLAISMALIFISMINIPESFGIISRMWHYLPGPNNCGPWMFGEYRMINLFGMLLNDFYASAFVWLIVSIVLIIVSKKLYKRI